MAEHELVGGSLLSSRWARHDVGERETGDGSRANAIGQLGTPREEATRRHLSNFEDGVVVAVEFPRNGADHPLGSNLDRCESPTEDLQRLAALRRPHRLAGYAP